MADRRVQGGVGPIRFARRTCLADSEKNGAVQTGNADRGSLIKPTK